MALIRRRSEPGFIRHLRQKFLSGPEYARIKRFWADTRNIYECAILYICYDVFDKNQIEKINLDLGNLATYYKENFIYAAGVPKGYTVQDCALSFAKYGARHGSVVGSASMVFYIKANPVLPAGIRKNLLPEDQDSTKLKIPKILFNIDRDKDPLKDVEALADIFDGLYNLAVEALDFGAENNPNCLLMVDIKNGQILFSESDMASSVSALVQECLSVLRSIPTMQQYSFPHWKNQTANLPIRSDVQKKARKINKLANRVGSSTRVGHQPGSHHLITTKNIYYDTAPRYHTSRRYGAPPQRNCTISRAISEGMTASDGAIFYSPEQVSGVFRGQTINNLVNAVGGLAWCAKYILRKHVKNYLDKNTYYMTYTICRMLTVLDALDVPNWKKQKVFDAALARYAPLVKRDSNILNLNGISPALRKFINKIGMPIELDNSYDSIAERQVAKRLRDLAKSLSVKYGVNYGPSAGDVVLAAMRKADDVDEIMLDISTALEDCFAYINAVADPSQE